MLTVLKRLLVLAVTGSCWSLINRPFLPTLRATGFVPLLHRKWNKSVHISLHQRGKEKTWFPRFELDTQDSWQNSVTCIANTTLQISYFTADGETTPLRWKCLYFAPRTIGVSLRFPGDAVGTGALSVWYGNASLCLHHVRISGSLADIRRDASRIYSYSIISLHRPTRC
jgi:hypothetical protein